MADGLTHRLVDLVYDALLKAFWRKQALKRFLGGNGVSESFLSSWEISGDESKRQFLDRLFPRLGKAKAGPVVLNQMARSLSEMSTFPDLQNWEDSEDKVRDATESVQILRDYLHDKDKERKSVEAAEKSRAEIREAQASARREESDLEELSERLTELHTRIGSQQAGYDFETWFYDLMGYCEIQHRRPYKVEGRQIDGSITIGDTTYLVELKFEREQTGAPAIDTFLRKVTTKADNTMGIMVAISGYSSVAIKEASGDRTPIMLLDHTHVFAVLGRRIRFRPLVERVRRHASQTSAAYLPVERLGAA